MTPWKIKSIIDLKDELDRISQRKRIILTNTKIKEEGQLVSSVV